MKTSARRELICISCPVGCQLDVVVEDGQLISVQGNKCPKGVSYARDEMFNPRRILTTTVRVRGGALRQLPVRTREAIPKRLLSEGMKLLSRYEVDAPVNMNDVLIPDFLGTGVDLIAGRSIESVTQQ